ncbi:TraR/DksA family transcriptional regulator [Fodinibius salsisoli]|uniref:TraR/DksA family transcriptional regulator n=1 Tax=Fodinibius salsisoli TaxID=2820877 RepID=A0ABT3PIH9_9BACT|nr:TraR/DksA C4-type zinc finger protein [Fodinibius salsisoli]MCW9705719.1 TraR/DksA family transcriptional regulator [Fodinibius salsisoli]
MSHTSRYPFTEEELKHFKKVLLEKRNDAAERLEEVRNAQTNLGEADDADYSSLAHHMADVGSEEQESEMNYLQIERVREYIIHINHALERIENKTYGICQATGKPISKERLEAVPHTRYSIEAKQKGLVKDQ